MSINKIYKFREIISGPSLDSLLLIFIKIITVFLGLVVTRILAENLSLNDYGTYSQVMLLFSTLSSLTILGMADAANYFFHNHFKDRSRYLSTICFIQFIIYLLLQPTLFYFSDCISEYFSNEKIKDLILFSSALSFNFNLICILQIVFIGIGKARQIAVINLIISTFKLILFYLVAQIFNEIVLIFWSLLFLDFIHILYFYFYIYRSGSRISLKFVDISIIKNIFNYGLPLAVYLIINSLSRDLDRYFISGVTNTETLAMYTNASKILPFDIIMVSFCTILIPYISKYLASNNINEALILYKNFLKLSILTTSMLAFSAIASAPMLMQLLYTEKYLNGLSIFIVYILIDIFRVFGITLIITASARNYYLVKVSVFALISNFVLNFIFYDLFGIIGPAYSTLFVTIISGFLILNKSASILTKSFFYILDIKTLFIYFLESLFILGFCLFLSEYLRIHFNLNYLIRLFFISGLYLIISVSLNTNRIILCLKTISKSKLS